MYSVYLQVRDGYSSKSFRLMALAVGIIPDVHNMDLLRMTQQQVEAHVTHMQLLCLVVYHFLMGFQRVTLQDWHQTLESLQLIYIVRLITLVIHICSSFPAQTAMVTR